MESEVGLFNLELDKDYNFPLFDLSSDSSSGSKEYTIEDEDVAKKLINDTDPFLIKFDAEYFYLHLHLIYIIDKFPIYSEILNPILKNSEYKMKFYEINNIITVEIINVKTIEYCFKNNLSLASFYKFCLKIKNIAFKTT